MTDAEKNKQWLKERRSNPGAESADSRIVWMKIASDIGFVVAGLAGLTAVVGWLS